MKNAGRIIRRYLKVLVFVGIALPFGGCAPGTVYVGVAAPGPWVGYPGRGYPGGYPGVYGRPWYSPDEEKPEEPKTAPETGAPEAPTDFGSAR
jgi:hypothetical protein